MEYRKGVSESIAKDLFTFNKPNLPNFKFFDISKQLTLVVIIFIVQVIQDQSFVFNLFHHLIVAFFHFL